MTVSSNFSRSPLRSCSTPASASAADDEDWKGDASGRVESKYIWLELGDVYPVREDSFADEGKAIQVAVSNGNFNKPFIDRYWNRPHFSNEFFAMRDGVFVVWLEFSPEGRYQGLSYYLEF